MTNELLTPDEEVGRIVKEGIKGRGIISFPRYEYRLTIDGVESSPIVWDLDTRDREGNAVKIYVTETGEYYFLTRYIGDEAGQ